MDEAILYVKTHLRTHKNRKYGVDLSQFDDFVMICVQNVRRKETFLSRSNFSRHNLRYAKT